MQEKWMYRIDLARLRRGIWIGGMLTLTWMPVVAQQRSDVLEEVTVTAQRRTENAQDVPASLAAFDQEALRKSGIATVDEIASRTPGFSMGNFNVGEPRFFIRGIGSVSDSAAGDPSVGVFQDEIYVGRISGASFDLFDLERVEVLRGPQGTLYGRNTAGGAINIVPNQATRDLNAGAEIDLGNYRTLAARGFLNGAVGQRSAARLAVSHRRHAGYSTNIVTGENLSNRHSSSARVMFNSELSDAIRIRLSVDRVRDRNGGNARVPGPVFTDQTGTNAIALAALLRLWPLDSDIRKSYSDPSSYQHRDIVGSMVRVEQDVSYGTWAFLGGWREVDLDWFEDFDALKPFGNPPLAGVPPATYGWIISTKDRAREAGKQYSAETRLSSSSASSLKWVLGTHYFNEHVERAEGFLSRFSLIPAASGDVAFSQDARTRSAAVYGQATAPLNRKLSITTGARYTRDDKSVLQEARNNDAADPTPGLPLFPGQPYSIKADEEWSSWTGKLGLEYQLTSGRLLYTSINRGFKAGIFPSQNNVIQNVGVATPPEKVMNYELGAKTEWADRRLRVNGALFYMDYDDLQLFRLDSQQQLITFTDNAKIRGAEFELTGTPTGQARIGLNYAYLDAHIKGGSNDGDTLPYAPRHKVGALAEYEYRFAHGVASGRIEYQWTDSFSLEVPNSREMQVPGYGLLDARVSYLLSDRKIELSLWGKNLTDKEYVTHTTPFLGNGFSIFGPPRTYGISVRWAMH